MEQTPTADHSKLISVILIAAVLIAGSLIFLGVQMGQNTSAPSELNQLELKQQIKTEIFAELQNGEFLAQEVEKGIQRFIQKQQEAQQKAREEQQRAAAEKAKNVRRVSPERDHIYGNPDADITLIEYSDFECPYCKNFHQTAKQLVDESEGKVNWVYRHYPLPFHNPHAQKEAEASECAAELGGNEAFWKYTDAIYDRTKSNKGFPLENLVPLAEEFGLDAAAFQECLDSGQKTARVEDDLKEGNEAGITGTPGNILLHNASGEVSLLTGAQPLNALQAAVEKLSQQE